MPARPSYSKGVEVALLGLDPGIRQQVGERYADPCHLQVVADVASSCLTHNRRQIAWSQQRSRQARPKTGAAVITIFMTRVCSRPGCGNSTTCSRAAPSPVLKVPSTRNFGVLDGNA